MRRLYHWLMRLLFPPKCVFCRCLLPDDQTDLCHDCRQNAPVMRKPNFKISFVAGWTAVWYYKDSARSSILRFKFSRRRSYAPFFGRELATKLVSTGLDEVDVVTYVPVSRWRKWRRGYDQSALLAQAVARELGVTAQRCFVKVRNTRPQTAFREMSQRQANVLGAFRVRKAAQVAGKRVLIIDDIVTTGATLSECAKRLQFAGCQEVYGAALAATPKDNKNKT